MKKVILDQPIIVGNRILGPEDGPVELEDARAKFLISRNAAREHIDNPLQESPEAPETPEEESPEAPAEEDVTGPSSEKAAIKAPRKATKS